MAQQDERSDLLEAFFYFDQDQDGYLSINELRHIITNLGQPMQQQEIEEFLREADNGSGRVNYHEFVETIFNTSQ